MTENNEAYEPTEDEKWAAVYLYDYEEWAVDVAEGRVDKPFDRAIGVAAIPWGKRLDEEVEAFSADDKELLIRAASTLADHLESWHGGPDEMYAEATRLRQLAALLAISISPTGEVPPPDRRV